MLQSHRSGLALGSSRTRGHPLWARALQTLCLSSPLWMVGSATAQVFGYHRLIAAVSAPDGNFHNAQGLNPYGELVQTADGRLYGAAFKGGANGKGTVFYVTDGGSAAKPVPIYTFGTIQAATPGGPQINADGATPDGLTVGLDGFIYGVTREWHRHRLQVEPGRCVDDDSHFHYQDRL
jgi:uncharacterized repeat protein (TIGR03803 family)